MSRSEHGPNVDKERVVSVCVSSHAVDIRGGAVEFGPVRVLQTDAEIQPWPKRRPSVAERQIGEIEDPASTVRASCRRTVQCRVGGAADRHPSGGQVS
jgi:hypothetical protein